MRLTGVAVTISPAERATGNHACGLRAATSVIGAMTRPSAPRCSSSPRPRCARRALSNNANVRYASKTAWLISEGSNSMSIGKGRFSAGRYDHCGRCAGLLEAAHGGQCLRAGDQCEVEAAGPDLPGDLGGEHVGHRAPDARVAPPRRRRPQPLGEARHRVVVLPGLRVDDVDALEAPQDVGGAGVVGRGTRQLLPHVERFGRALVAGVPGAAGDAHDAGGAGVGAHDRWTRVRRATCPAWRWPGRR